MSENWHVICNMHAGDKLCNLEIEHFHNRLDGFKYSFYVHPNKLFGLFRVLGPVVRKVNSAIHRIVIFSTVVKMLEKL